MIVTFYKPKMERELRTLKSKVQELTQENLALREINIRFQLENFKLQKNIESFEKTQIEIETTAEDGSFELCDANYDSNIEFLEGTYDSPVEGAETKDFIVIEDDSLIEAKAEDLITKARTKRKRRANRNEDPILEEIFGEDELAEFESNGLDPRNATKAVHKIASNRGVLENVKSVQNVRAKDSHFVNQVLEVLYSRDILANSSARGQKCQSQSTLPPRPALDPVKLNICRQAFVHRLVSLPLSDFDDRLKMFNNYVNTKVQNTRKLFLREQKKNLITDQ